MPRRRLKSTLDVRRFLASVLTRMESGEIEAGLGSRLAYVSNVLLKALELSAIERRIESLEAQLRE